MKGVCKGNMDLIKVTHRILPTVGSYYAVAVREKGVRGFPNVFQAFLVAQ